MTEPTPSPLNNVITIDNSVEEDLIEMYLAGISECAVSKTSRKPYGARGYRSRRCQTMNRKIYGTIEAWCATCHLAIAVNGEGSGEGCGHSQRELSNGEWCKSFDYREVAASMRSAERDRPSVFTDKQPPAGILTARGLPADILRTQPGAGRQKPRELDRSPND